MTVVERKLEQDSEQHFDDMLGQPLFLARTLALIHIVALQVVNQGWMVEPADAFARFIAGDAN